MATSVIEIPHYPKVLLSHAESAANVLVGDAGSSGDATGIMLWPGSWALLSYLASPLFSDRIGRGIVELGCGTGIVSAALGLKFPEDLIIATDGSHSAIDNTKRTLRLNGLATPAKVWDWSSGTPLESLGNAETIVAAEIVYPSTTKASFEALFSQISKFVAVGDSRTFVLSYVQRRPETTLMMLEAANLARLTVRKVDWEHYADKEPAMGAQILVFKSGEEDLEKLLENEFTGLKEHIERAERVRRDLAAEAEEFVLPAPDDDF